MVTGRDPPPFPSVHCGDRPLAHRNRTLWRSANGAIEVGVWEVDAGRCHADFGRFGASVHVVAGEMRCVPDDGGAPFALQAGDWMTFPQGWTGEWRLPSLLRTVSFTWEAR